MKKTDEGIETSGGSVERSPFRIEWTLEGLPFHVEGIADPEVALGIFQEVKHFLGLHCNPDVMGEQLVPGDCRLLLPGDDGQLGEVLSEGVMLTWDDVDIGDPDNWWKDGGNPADWCDGTPEDDEDD